MRLEIAFKRQGVRGDHFVGSMLHIALLGMGTGHQSCAIALKYIPCDSVGGHVGLPQV